MERTIHNRGANMPRNTKLPNRDKHRVLLTSNYSHLEQRALAKIREMTEQTSDPLEDILGGVEGEDRQVVKQLTFSERYGATTSLRTKEEQDELVRNSKESTSGTAHTV